MASLTRANAVHVRIQGRQCGPLTQDQVKALVRQGTASANDAISVDGGERWTTIGQTSLVKYVPVKRVHGRLQPPTMPDHIDLSVTAEVMALPPPSERELARPAQKGAPPKPSSKPGVLWGVGAGCLAVGLLFGIVVGRMSAPAAIVKKPEGPPPPPVLRLAEVDRRNSGQIISLVGMLGKAEERAEPAQLPGFASRCVLVRIHAQDASLMAAIPLRDSEEPARANTVFVSMNDSGFILDGGNAKLCDASGAAIARGGRMKITGKVRFKVSDVSMLFPILEVSKIEPVVAEAPKETPKEADKEADKN